MRVVEQGSPGLSLPRILAEAVALVDASELRALTMRALAGRLGVEAMTLYHYVPSKAALLDGVAESLMDDLDADPEVRERADAGWQEYLARLAHGVRRMALAHPEVFPLVATQPSAVPWIRPPLRSVRWVERLLVALLEHGFDDDGALDAYRAFTSFLLGHLLLDVSARGVDAGPVEEVEPGPPRTVDLEGFPILVRLQPELSQDHSLAEFEASLEVLLERLETTRLRRR